MEQGATSSVLSRPRHPYTRALIAATPDHRVSRELETLPGVPVDPLHRGPGCAFAPRCSLRVDACEATTPSLLEITPSHEVRCPEWARTPLVDWQASEKRSQREPQEVHPVLRVSHLEAFHQTRTEKVVAARDISFEVATGECVALVGESGSGKTTIARSIAGLHGDWSGTVEVLGQAISSSARARSREQLRRVQMVFQNPADTLNPRQDVGTAIARPASLLRGLSRAEAAAEVERLLDAVRLPVRYAERFPHELSGGQRQRVSIARALAADPSVVVCDEITSALDVSVQAVVLDVLDELRQESGLSLLFITHDLAVVSAIADKVLVLADGAICEAGAVRDVLDGSTNAYVRRLLAAAPSLSDETREQPA